MVKGSTLSYGSLMEEARNKTDIQQVGETTEPIMARFKQIIDEAVQANHDKGVTGQYYIHIWVQKEPYAQNALRIYPQCRLTRPSPYQGHDHYLWSVNGAEVKFEWCIPKKEVLTYILHNPNEFDKDYVAMLRRYSLDKIDNIEDYMFKEKVI